MNFSARGALQQDDDDDVYGGKWSSRCLIHSLDFLVKTLEEVVEDDDKCDDDR